MKNLDIRVQLVAQKVTENVEKQLELASQVNIHEHGNKERIDDLSGQLDLILKWKILAIKNNSARFLKSNKYLIAIYSVF